MQTEHYDLVVIGSGPAGVQGALEAAHYGRRVALVEREPVLGGAAVNTGTVPSKTLRETALYFSGLRQRGLYGIDYSLKEGLTVRDFLHRQRIVVEQERDQMEQDLNRHRVRIVWGTGALLDAHTVQVQLRSGGVEHLQADVMLIATGSSPHHAADIPFDGRRVFDSDTILQMDRIPATMAVVGGGVIGCEYASIFTALGVQVTLVQAGDRLLPSVDSAIAERLQQHLEQLGLRFLFNAQVTGIDTGDGARLTLEGGEQVAGDIALFCAGRQSNVEGLGLEGAGVKLGARGLVIVDDQYRTSVPHIYAAGDVIGFPALASTSMEQGRVAVTYAFDLPYKEHISPVVPFAVYTVPEIAMAGLTEDDCKQQDIPYLVSHAYYEQLARGQIIGDYSGMLKLIFSPADGKVLGVHHIGELSSELVHIGARLIAAGGMVDDLLHTVYNYPTLSEVYRAAAYDAIENRDQWHVLEGRMKDEG